MLNIFPKGPYRSEYLLEENGMRSDSMFELVSFLANFVRIWYGQQIHPRKILSSLNRVFTCLSSYFIFQKFLTNGFKILSYSFQDRSDSIFIYATTHIIKILGRKPHDLTKTLSRIFFCLFLCDGQDSSQKQSSAII